MRRTGRRRVPGVGAAACCAILVVFLVAFATPGKAQDWEFTVPCFSMQDGSTFCLAREQGGAASDLNYARSRCETAPFGITALVEPRTTEQVDLVYKVARGALWLGADNDAGTIRWISDDVPVSTGEWCNLSGYLSGTAINGIPQIRPSGEIRFGCWDEWDFIDPLPFVCGRRYPGVSCPANCALCDPFIGGYCPVCKGGFSPVPFGCEAYPDACPPLSSVPGLSYACEPGGNGMVGSTCTASLEDGTMQLLSYPTVTCSSTVGPVGPTANWAHEVEATSLFPDCTHRLGDSCWKMIRVDTGDGFDNAHQFCLAEGMLPAWFDSRDEVDFGRSVALDAGVAANIFFGLNDAVDDGVFRYDSGHPVSYTNWYAHEPPPTGAFFEDPNNGAEFDHSVAYMAGDGTWFTGRNSDLSDIDVLCRAPACGGPGCTTCTAFDGGDGSVPGGCSNCRQGWIGDDCDVRVPHCLADARGMDPRVVFDGGACGGLVGDVCQLACDEGFILSGPASRTCLGSTEWSGASPVCLDESLSVPCFYNLGGRCFEIAAPGASWSDARQICTGIGMSLVSIHSAEEQSFFDFILADFAMPSAWLGLSDEIEDERYTWTDGTPLDYSLMRPFDDMIPGKGYVYYDPVNFYWRATADEGESHGVICVRNSCAPQCSSCSTYSNCLECADGFFGEPECRIFVPSPPQVAPKIAVLSPTSFNVSWDDASDYASGDALQWEVFVDGSAITEFDVNRGTVAFGVGSDLQSRTVTLVNLMPAVDYVVQVRAVGLAGPSALSPGGSARTFVHCPDGQVALSLSGPCEACEAGTYELPPVAGTDLGTCLDCPALTTSVALSSSISDCICVAGAYAVAPAGGGDGSQGSGSGAVVDGSSGAGADCRDCPTGATCAGGDAAPVALPGYFPSPDGDNVFLLCSRPLSCAGGSPFSCSEGYAGRLCAACNTTYYKLGETCRECSKNGFLVILIVFLLVLGLCAFLTYFNLQDRTINRLAGFTIGFNSLQIAAIYGKLDLDYHAIAQSFFDALSFFNFDLEITSPECAVELDNVWYLKFLLTMSLPLIFGAFFLLTYALAMARLVCIRRAWCCCAGGGGTRKGWCCTSPLTSRAVLHAIRRAMWQILALLYLPLVAMNLRFYDCAKGADGVWTLSADPSVVCYVPPYWGYLPVSITTTLLYCFGIPVAILALLHYKRKRLGEVKFELRYGFLVSRFSEERFTFETWVMVRKAAIVVTQLGVFTSNDYVKASWGAFVLGVALCHLIYHQPYRTRIHNALAIYCLSAAVIVLWISGADTVPDALRHAVVVTAILTSMVAIIFIIALDIKTARKDASQKDDDLFEGGDDGDGKLGDVGMADFGRHSIEVSNIGESPGDTGTFRLSNTVLDGGDSEWSRDDVDSSRTHTGGAPAIPVRRSHMEVTNHNPVFRDSFASDDLDTIKVT